jgi:steroid 5-alpha reductase family enzyme
MSRELPRPTRAGSFGYILGVYIVAVGVAWLVFELAPFPPHWAMVAGLFASVAVTFAAALHTGNGSVFDAWWSVLPPVAALWLTGLSPHVELTARQLAVHTVVWFWAVRLTANWARGWTGLDHEDWRYVDLVARWPMPAWLVRLVPVMLIPAAFVAAGCLPLYPALALGDGAMGLLDVVALALGLAATSLELVADEQMRMFTARRRPGEVMQEGVWRWSRHPNYLGEICFWVSLWLFALAAAPDWWWTGVGALAILGLFVFGSIPLLDDRSRERRPGFAEYAARTPALLPRRPRDG